MDRAQSLIIICLLATYSQSLTNPLKLISQPANQVEVDMRLQVYIIKVQHQSVLGLSRMQGCDATVTLCTSPLVDLANPYFTWNDNVFEKGRNMTKEQFMKKDWKFNETFRHFKFVKDTYDGLKIVPLPKVNNHRLAANEESTVAGVKTVFSYTEQIEVVVLDLNTEHLKGAGDQKNKLLADICASLGIARLRTNLLCVFEIEEEIPVESEQNLEAPVAFDRKRTGNFVTIPLQVANTIGMHVEEPELMPLSPLTNPKLRKYLDDLKGLYYKDAQEIIHQYAKHITTAFGDIKEEVWLSENKKIISELTELKKWRKQFEISLNQLEKERILEEIIPKLKEIFSILYQGYRSNAEKSTRKLDVYEKRTFLIKLMLKYPITLLLGVLLLLSCFRFYKREKKTITRILDKSTTI